MMKGLIFPGMAAALLSAQGAFAALFSDGTYAIAPANGKNNYLASDLNGFATLSEYPYAWKVETSNGRWTIQLRDNGQFLDHGADGEHHNSVPIRGYPSEWEIQQHDHGDRTWRIVKPQSRDHPNYGDISVLTYHDSERRSSFNHKIDVQDLAIDSSDLIQYWQFVSV